MSPVKVLGRDARVSMLIDGDSKRWNVGLIDNIFMEDEARVIKSIPINPRWGGYFVIWHASPNGQFSVKNAYILALSGSSSSINGRGESSNSRSKEAFWKHLWKLKLPPKIKVFGWKVCRNILPTRMNLRRRGMEIEVNCPTCGKEAESMLHSFHDCKSACTFWSLCSSVLGIDGSDALLTFRDVLHEGRSHEASSLLLGLWWLWFNRNAVLTGSCLAKPLELLQSALRSKEEWARYSAPVVKLKVKL